MADSVGVVEGVVDLVADRRDVELVLIGLRDEGETNGNKG